MGAYWIQVSALSTWSFLFLIPTLLRGTNIVTNTFTEGTLRFWSGLSPYDPSKVADVFHYSPLFCFLYRPITWLPNSIHALTWAFLNVSVFWAGVSLWHKFSKNSPKWFWAALALCAIELDISQRYQQMNAMLAGLVLISLYFYKKEKFVAAALPLTFITNIKLLPVVFLFLMLWPVHKRFVVSASGFLLVWFLLPSLAIGLDKNTELHVMQFTAIANDTASGHGGRSMLDFSSTLTRIGYGELSGYLRPVNVLLVLCGALLTRLFGERVSTGLFYSFVMLSLLVLSPRTESPTFVFLAPAYIFLMEELNGFRKGLVIFAGFFISFVFTSVWAPHFTWTHHQHYYSKVFGTYILWLSTIIIIWRRIFTAVRWPKYLAVNSH